MNCSNVDQLLTQRVAGDLDPADAGWLERHLQSCPACAQRAAEAERLERGLASLREAYERVSPPFVFQPADAGTGASGPRRRVVRLVRIPLAAAAALVALLSLWPGTTPEQSLLGPNPVAEAPVTRTTPWIMRTPPLYLERESAGDRSAAFVTRLPRLMPEVPSRPTGPNAVRPRTPSLFIQVRSKPNVNES